MVGSKMIKAGNEMLLESSDVHLHLCDATGKATLQKKLARATVAGDDEILPWGDL